MSTRKKKTANGLSLVDKVVIVTGGATGIGEAICKVFAAYGASVVVNGLPGDPVEQVVEEIIGTGGKAIACVTDCASAEGANGCVQMALHDYGRLDVLVCNAGLFPEEAEVDESSIENFEDLLHTNIEGVYLPVRAALPELKKTQGNVITLGSEAAMKGTPGLAAYSGTKGGSWRSRGCSPPSRRSSAYARTWWPPGPSTPR